MAVWPRPCLERPLLRRLDGILARSRGVEGAPVDLRLQRAGASPAFWQLE